MTRSFTSEVPCRRFGDEGVAMVLVLSFGLLVLGLVLVMAESILRQMVPSTHAEHSYAALAAAEAGIEDLKARLLVNGVYYRKADPTNPALGGWAPVPGGNTDAEFTYAIDTSKAGVGGGLTVVATGRSHGETRTVVTTLGRRSTLDYTYMSDIETTAPKLPGTYSTLANTGGTGQSAQDLAKDLCSRRFWENNPEKLKVSPTETGNERNQNFCQFADILNSETLDGGPIHTNDIFRFGGVLNAADIGATLITTSCPSSDNEALAVAQGPNGARCPSGHRFIYTIATRTNNVDPGDYQPPGKVGTSNVNLKSSNQVNSLRAQWDSATKAYQGNNWFPTTFPTGSTWTPSFDTVLELPLGPDALIPRASEQGCIYTGPTRIRFAVESGVGYMYVTSPNTKYTSAACAGSLGMTGLKGSPGTVPDPTAQVRLDQFTDLVIYVQNVPRSGMTDNDENAWDLNTGAGTYDNTWAANAEPSCTRRSPLKIATQANVTAVTGSSPTWTVTVSPTAPATTSGFGVGSPVTATAGTGTIGSGGTYVVTTATGTSSITIKASGGSAPKTGTITNLTRGSTKYPYVVPTTGVDPASASAFSTGRANTFGFPSEFAPEGSPFFGSSCSLGDLYVSGTYSGGKFTNSFNTSVTMAAGNNVILTGSLIVDGASTSTGAPTASSKAMVGLVSNEFTYIYRPLTADNTWPQDWPVANQETPKYDAAILAVNECFAAQREFSSGYSTLTIYGSLAQKYRCPVGQGGSGITGGYTKAYHYDTRLQKAIPPFFTELSAEPWKRNAYAEVSPSAQNALVKNWPLATTNDTGAAFANLKVAYGPATVSFMDTNPSIAGNDTAQVTVSPGYPLAAGKSGLVVLSYDVTKNGYTEGRSLVISVE